MADRLLLESGSPDGYLLEDGSGVLLLDAIAGGIALVQPEVTGSTTGALTFTMVLGSLPTTGDTLIASISSDANETPSGGGVTTWALADFGAAHTEVGVWYGVVDTTPNATVTVTRSSAVIGVGTLSEWGAVLTPSPLDQHSPSAGTASTTIATSSITPTQDAELVYATASYNGAANPSAGPTNGLTGLTTASCGGATNRHVASGYVVQPTAAAVSSGWTIGTSTWDAVIVSFKATPPAVENPMPYVGGGYYG